MVIADFVDYERRRCFEYFYDNFSRDGKTFGLMHDMYPTKHNDSSVAASGYLLAAMVVGVDFGYVSAKEAEEICAKVLKTHAKLETKQGFYYHFYNMWDGERARKSELSIIDTALYLAGALTAGAFFGGEVLRLAREQYLKCNWEYFYSKEKKMFYMGEFYDRGFSGYWDWYAEQLITYFLAAGSPKGEKIALEAYEGFAKPKGAYGGYEYIYSWFGSLFTHQFSHAFLDLKDKVDKDGVNWFKNSVNATKANRAYCIAHKDEYKSYGEDGWGLTSCLTPRGYTGHIGVEPSGNGNTENISDGTIPPCGALGSLPFTPKESLSALRHFYSKPGLVGKYGLTDSYNEDRDWISDSYISIDKGITLLMTANYEKQTVWRVFNSLPEIKKAYETLHFKKEKI